MYPGLGVGGYCITKDPYYGKYSAKNYIILKILIFLYLHYPERLTTECQNTQWMY